MGNVKCKEVAGAMYAFPRITLPKKAIESAKVSCPVSGPDFQATVQNTVSNGYLRCTVMRIPQPVNFFLVD